MMLFSTVLISVMGFLIDISLGANQPRIYMGAVEDIRNYPFMIYLQIEDKNNKSKMCGATLISARHILTAEHCLQDMLKATAIYNCSNPSLREPNCRSVEIVDYKVPPPLTCDYYRELAWSSHVYACDIAIGVLKTAIEDVLPVELPKFRYEIPRFTKGLALGWGAIEGFVNETMNTIVMGTELRSTWMYVENGREVDTFSARGTAGNACQGDSGGPFLIDDVQYGISSTFSDCGDNEKNNFNYVAMYMDFIEEYIGQQ